MRWNTFGNFDRQAAAWGPLGYEAPRQRGGCRCPRTTASAPERPCQGHAHRIKRVRLCPSDERCPCCTVRCLLTTDYLMPCSLARPWTGTDEAERHGALTGVDHKGQGDAAE